ncbi:FtsX-like permease family protein [Corynebacterium freiburgense]|uniref:FtsX-like permease family protein n=1 Tax=Corynebacterium freiburgense TaxID=556548 RepID=UPI000413A149|nr:FtsX-like permease family protein [Corynebacterium freiburgense]WJZ03736.1 outer membrane-specific lipoprotein transporter subunit LolC [Corynebacterium freiburgense]
MLGKLQLRGLIPSIFTVAIGVFMLTFALTLGDSVRSGLEASARAIVGQAGVVVSGSAKTNHSVDEIAIAEITELDQSVQIRTFSNTVAYIAGGKTSSKVVIESVPEFSATTKLVSGRLPTAPQEVAISQSVFRSQGYSEGSVIQLFDNNQKPTIKVTVVGVISPGGDAATDTGTLRLYAQDTEIMESHGLAGYSKVYVFSEDPQILERITDLPAVRDNELQVTSAEAEVQRLMRASTPKADLIVSVMAALGVLCVVVTAIVVASVFQTFALRRRREFALLRCLGASKHTVFLLVCKEGLFVGVLGSIIGLILGISATKIFVDGQSGFLGSTVNFSVSVLSVVLALSVGIISTMGASLRPAKLANSASPALIVDTYALLPGARTISGMRAIIALLLLAISVGMLIFANSLRSLILSVSGGLVFLIAIILMLPPLVMAAGKLLSIIAKALGNIPFTLGMENMVRNVHRSANAALAISVVAALAAMATVGFATVYATTLDFSDRKTPVDAILVGAINEQTLNSFSEIRGVETARLLPIAEVTIQTPGQPNHQAEIIGVSTVDQAMLRTDTLGGPITSDTIILGDAYQIPNGESATVVAGPKQVTLQTKILESRVAGAIVSKEVFDRLAGQQQAHVLWIRFAGAGIEPAARDQVMDLAANQELEVIGQVAPRIDALNLVKRYHYIALGIVLLALFVALVGVVTTAGLSVFERNEEILLLRALGATPRTVVSAFALEALAIAGIGAIAGTVLGAAAGVIGVWGVFAGGELPPVFDFNIPQLAMVCIGCTIFGGLSTLSASYRAVRATKL